MILGLGFEEFQDSQEKWYLSFPPHFLPLSLSLSLSSFFPSFLYILIMCQLLFWLLGIKQIRQSLCPHWMFFLKSSRLRYHLHAVNLPFSGVQFYDFDKPTELCNCHHNPVRVHFPTSKSKDTLYSYPLPTPSP